MQAKTVLSSVHSNWHQSLVEQQFLQGVSHTYTSCWFFVQAQQIAT